MTEGALAVRQGNRADDRGNLCLVPSSILSSSSGSKTIAHRANIRQMANHEMKNLSQVDSGLATAPCKVELIMVA
jgi:hypothetical protein